MQANSLSQYRANDCTPTSQISMRSLAQTGMENKTDQDNAVL